LIQAARPLDSKVAHLEGAADFCNKIRQKQTSHVWFEMIEAAPVGCLFHSVRLWQILLQKDFSHPDAQH
jgi:hypothetical protein